MYVVETYQNNKLSVLRRQRDASIGRECRGGFASQTVEDNRRKVVLHLRVSQMLTNEKRFYVPVRCMRTNIAKYFLD